MPPALRPATRSILPLALAIGVLVGAGCGGDDAVDQQTFRDDLEERTTIPAGVADCITDGVYERFEQDEVDDIYRAPTDDELRDQLGEAAFADINEINQRCWAEADDSTDDTSGGTSGDGSSEGGSSDGGG